MIAISALVGLAASSKFHFGLWLLTPLICVWLGDPATFRHKWRLSLGIVVVAGCVVVTLVPWFWINPLLALKEFTGVVLVKVSLGSSISRLPAQAAILFGDLGLLMWLGALGGLGAVWARQATRALPVIIPTAVGAGVLLVSATVFNRYAIVLLPGLLLLAGMGWEWWLSGSRTSVRRAAAVALLASLAITVGALVQTQRRAGEADVDVLARDWILANVSRGSTVALHNEVNAFLPRSREELRACTERITAAEAYREKWLVEGVKTSLDEARPMGSVVLNDERFYAHWCRRELAVQTDPGYNLVSYHAEPRFGAVLEDALLADFRKGSGSSLGSGVDVLVTNRLVDLGRAPVQVFRTERGTRAIYRR
jgi:hypothetical protein